MHMKGFTNASAPDGQPIKLIRLSNAFGASAVFMDWGATWLSLLLPMTDGSQRETLLRCDSMADHLQQHAYLGATVGRFASRIRQGVIIADGRRIQLATNDRGNTLHGGPIGFDSKRWTLEEATDNSVTFSLRSPDGDQGFPGNLRVLAYYQLLDDNTLCAQFSADSDAVTPVSLTNHAYFNLAAGQHSILDHHLRLDADYYLPLDETGIPCGELTLTANSRFDFRKPRPFSQDLPNGKVDTDGYDQGYLLNSRETPVDSRRPVASLWDGNKTLRMDIATDLPAMQVYTGNHLHTEPAGVNRNFAQHAGVALETAFLPDSPNLQIDQPSCFLRPGASKTWTTLFHFTAL